MGFPLTPRSMTLDDLELHKSEFLVNFAGFRRFRTQQQLNVVSTSNWSNFWQTFASRGFVSDSWAFLLTFIFDRLCTLIMIVLLLHIMRNTLCINGRMLYCNCIGLAYPTGNDFIRWYTAATFTPKFQTQSQNKSFDVLCCDNFSEHSKFKLLCYGKRHNTAH